MPFLELFDETLDINSTLNYDLSVQISSGRVSFCILDTIRKKYVLIRDYIPEGTNFPDLEGVEEILGKDEFLSRKYRKINIITPSPKFTIVPTPVYDKVKMEEYFRFNHVAEEGSIILASKLNYPDSYLVYSTSRTENELITRHLESGKVMHHLIPLMNYISESRKGAQVNHIHLHIERDFFNIILFDHSSLKLCNSFFYKNISDILYYIMNAFRNLNIGQEETIYISGDYQNQAELNTALSQYVRHIRYSVPSNGNSFSYVFNEVEIHRFLTIFSTTSCE